MNAPPPTHATGTLASSVRGRHGARTPSPSPARRRALALIALLALPSSAWAIGAQEVLRYDLFSDRPVGSAGEMEVAAARDGHVLLAWTAWRPAVQRMAVRVQWLAPDGTPLGKSFEAMRDGGPVAVAARPGRGALIVSLASPPKSGYRLTVVDAAGVVRRWQPADFGCEFPSALTATGSGYFLSCFETQPARFAGWWLSETGRPGRRVEIGPGYAVALAGGLGQGVFALYQGEDGRLLARWLTPWKQGPPVVVDDRAAWPPEVSAAHLRDRVFGVTWLREYARSADPEDGRRITAIQAATFRAPDLVRFDRRFSRLSGSLEEATGEQTRPFVFRTAAREQVVAWFGCAYGSSPAGLVCFERDGLFLRARVGARPAGGILELADVARHSEVVFTGERLLTLRLFDRAEDRWDLEIRGFVLE